MKKLSNFFSTLIANYLPSAFVIAILLTFFVFILGLVIQGVGFFEMTLYWGNGFWDFLTFSMQMVLILVTGGALANSKPIELLLTKASSIPSTNSQAVLLATIVSLLGCYINWGFGLIVSALFACSLIKSSNKFNAGLILASSYSGFLVWHGGISGSIPLKLTSPSSKVQSIIEQSSIGLESTLFSNFNLSILFAVVLTTVATNWFMSLKPVTVDNNVSVSLGEETDFNSSEKITKSEKGIENSSALAFLFVGLALFYLLLSFSRGASLDLNKMIFIFFILGLFLHASFYKYQLAFKNSLGSSYGIILQFPLYAGIMGMMNGSGLAQEMSQFFISISTEKTFLLNTFLSAGLLNFFVPSGGGQWVIQGPIVLSAARELGVSFSSAAMAISWGDAWTNMIQPFWALPILAIAKVELSTILSYLLVVFISVGTVCSLFFLFY